MVAQERGRPHEPVTAEVVTAPSLGTVSERRAVMSVGESGSGGAEYGQTWAPRDVLVGILAGDPLTRVAGKLDEKIELLGSARLVLVDRRDDERPSADAAPVEFTVDVYSGVDGHTHVVVGYYAAGGTWEILTDTAIP
jgi:hypothetical protein